MPPLNGEQAGAPAGAAGAAAQSTENGQSAVPVFEHEGQKYEVPSIIKEVTELRTKAAESEKQLSTLMEDSEALQVIIDQAKSNPELKSLLRAALSGEPIQRTPVTNEAQPQPKGKGSEQPTDPILQQILENQQRGQTESQALRGAVGQIQLEAEKSSLVRKYGFMKEKGAYEEMLARGADLAERKAQELRAAGVPLMQARSLAQDQVARLSLEQLMRTVMVKEYDNFILKAGKSSTEIDPESITTAAEQIGQGQAGPTPGDQEQFIKALAASAGDPTARRRIYAEFAAKMNVSPVELFGLDPSLKRS